MKLGVSSTGLPSYSEKNTFIDQYTPVVSPVFGLDVQWRYGKHSGLRAGIQYQTVGGEYCEAWPMQIMDELHYREWWSSWEFTRVSMPFLYTYSFTRFKKSLFSLQLGFKPGLLISATDRYRFKQTIDGQVKDHVEYGSDLLDENQFMYFDALNFQMFAGFSAQITPRISASLMASNGPRYRAITVFGSCFSYSYENSDLEFTVTYFPKF